jgi:hypothetical protein
LHDRSTELSPQSKKNLELVLSVALEHIQNNLDQFMTNATAYQVTQTERSVTKIRTLAAQVQKQFDALENLISKARNSSGATPNKLG